MIILACGGRKFRDRYKVYKALNFLHAERGITSLIEGEAPGADTLSREWAEELGIPVQKVPADWDTYGKAAGAIRNKEMLKLKPDGVVAFPGGNGTRDMINQSIKAGLRVWQPYKETKL